MKQIINGKMYNTETATALAYHRTALSLSDFRYLEERLYVTRKGTYFFYGEGGPATRYAHHCSDGGWDGGSKIIVVTKEEAMEWAEEHVDAEDLEDIFGEIEEG